MRIALSSLAAIVLGWSLPIAPARTQAPVDTPLLAGLDLPVGFACHGTDLMFVYQRRGDVRVVVDGTLLAPPLIDLREEVGAWRDFGLLGFALDPQFAQNGHYYLSYVVDRHHLLHHGTPAYRANADEYYAATIVRVTRYTADVATGFTTTVPGSRLVLFGESPSTGAPITQEIHGAGQLAFGRDGTLLVGIGDGAGGLGPDTGSHASTYYQQALSDGILRPAENVGAFRAQMVGSCSGKILRLDPATGDGVPSNPFYDPAQPRAPRSRVWALGLRNPFRLGVRPGTGSSDPSLGDPGSIYLGDVGWYTREELDVVQHGGQNLGWPLFEGIEANPAYTAQPTANLDAPNPLFGLGGCSQSHFTFQELLQQDVDSHMVFFPNPCDPLVGIAAATPTFVHRPPVLDWDHQALDARVPVFENGVLVARQLGTPAAGVPGQPFRGSCAVGGAWHSGISFPLAFGPCYYLGDFGEGWIRRLEFDGDDELVAVHEFADAYHVLMLGESPVDHSLIWVGLQAQLRELSYGIEAPPVAVPLANVHYGTGSFDVELDGRASFDPQGQALTYFWDLGNGRTSTSPQLVATYHGTGAPSTRDVALTVTDPYAVSDTTVLPIALDNTPPVVAITSFANGARYSQAGPTTLPLDASVSDAEHGPSQLAYRWQVFLHHEHHVHPQPPDSQPSTSATLSPTPPGAEFYAYRVELTVTDAGGLSTTVTKWLFPDAAGASTSVWMTSPATGDRFEPGAPVEFRALTEGGVQRVEYLVDGELVGVASAPPFAVSWTPTGSGTVTAVALAIGTDGTSSCTGGVAFECVVPTVTRRRGKGAAVDAVEALDQLAAPITTGGQLPLGDDGTPWLAGLRFEAPDVPVGARVQGAWIDFRAAGSDAMGARLTIACEAAASARPIDPVPGNLRHRKPGRSQVRWVPPAWVTGASGPAQRTPDLAGLVQPIVDQAKWDGSLLCLIRGSGLRRAVTWNGDPMVGPLLSVAWLPPLATPLALDDLGDSVEVLATGAVGLTDPALVLGQEMATAHAVGLEFELPLAASAQLESARLQFTSAGNDTGPAVLLIGIEAADDAAPLAANAFDISARARVADAITWYPPEWGTPGVTSTAQRSPELAPLLAQILARPGWVAGGRVVFVLEGTGTRTAASQDAGPSAAPRLDLLYRE